MRLFYFGILLVILVTTKVHAKQARPPTLVSASQASFSAGPVQATSADTFVDSIGVATHWAYPAYAAKRDDLESILIKSGIRHIRDEPGAEETIGRLHSRGLKLTLLVDAVHGLVPDDTYWSGASDKNTHTLADYLLNVLPYGVVEALEMPNELDTFFGTYKWRKSDSLPLSSSPLDSSYFGAYGSEVTRACWQLVKSDPRLASIKIIGPTVGTRVPSPYSPGSLHDFVDFGGFHPYPGRANTWTYPQAYDGIDRYYWNSSQPSVNIGTDDYGGSPLMFSWYQGAFANEADARPMIATETGYHTGLSALNSISVIAQAKYIPRLFAEYFRNGIVRTFGYEFYDEGLDQSDPEQNFGLIYNSGQPKPAFYALVSLIHLLQEPGASFAPGFLDYKISAHPNGAYTRTGYVHDLLLQKSNGDFYLLVWHEISDTSNTDSSGLTLLGPQRELSPRALETEISLPSNIRAALLYTYDSHWNLQSVKLPVSGNSITVQSTDVISVVQLSSKSR